MTRIDKISFRNIDFFILRDDLIDGDFNGNKARKLEYFLHCDISKFDKIVSYGSNQSNAMYSISVFAKRHNLDFIYVCDHIGNKLKENPVGNFKFAIENGMKYFVDKDRENFAKNLVDTKTLFIKEGVAQKEAEFGFIKQAEFIDNFSKKQNIKFDIFLPSGTGASAAYLSKNIKFNVFTTPCVGDTNYLKEQIYELDSNSKVQILNPPKKYTFGDIKKELYEIYKELLDETKIEFDLIYDTVGFLTLFSNLDKFKNPILYIHQGGIIGNISQLERYRYKGISNL
ncbi:1-aminocyclopropane-1-carboxylate deaminase [Campylobacter sputorum]|uniref:1-aminocyclopropane-1-carboxylate deaminase n=1 Tax=Campylobacter sputorum TaxID=206 RepID=UPI000B79434C